MSDKVKLQDDGYGEYLLVKFVEVKDMTQKGVMNWCRKARRKVARLKTYSTLPGGSKKMYINQVYDTKSLADWLSNYIDNGMRIQIQRFVRKKRKKGKIRTPSYFRVGKKIAEVELKNNQLKIFNLSGLSKMHWFGKNKKRFKKIGVD